eukprot:tig00000900_g5394.t1
MTEHIAFAGPAPTRIEHPQTNPKEFFYERVFHSPASVEQAQEGRSEPRRRHFWVEASDYHRHHSCLRRRQPHWKKQHLHIHHHSHHATEINAMATVPHGEGHSEQVERLLESFERQLRQILDKEAAERRLAELDAQPYSLGSGSSPADGDGDGHGGGGGGGGDGGGQGPWEGGFGDSSWPREEAALWPPDARTLQELALAVAGTAYAFGWAALQGFERMDVEAAPVPLQVLYGLLQLGQFVGVARIGQLLHPHAVVAARGLAEEGAPLAHAFLSEGVDYAMTIFGLVYAIMLGSVYDDTSAKQDHIREAAHREVGNLNTVMLLGQNMNGGNDLPTKTEIFNMIHEYACCVLKLDFSRKATICSRCAGILNRVEKRLMEMADDGRQDKVDRVNLGALLSALRNAQESRSVRISAFETHLSWMLAARLRGLSALLTAGFLYSSSGSPRLDALLWGTLIGVFVKLDQVYQDLADWTQGEWKVTPYCFEQLLDTVEADMRELKIPVPSRAAYNFVARFGSQEMVSPPPTTAAESAPLVRRRRSGRLDLDDFAPSLSSARKDVGSRSH